MFSRFRLIEIWDPSRKYCTQLLKISLQLMEDGVTMETGHNALLCVKEELKQEKELVLNLLLKMEELTV